MTATGAAAAGDARGAARLFSIGEVLNLLRPEFADVTISKLRFLESEGLVDPLRTPAGYRKYTPAHVERLRLVLAAQRDRYLPLRVIREQLQAAERGERVVGSFLGDLANRPSGLASELAGRAGPSGELASRSSGPSGELASRSLGPAGAPASRASGESAEASVSPAPASVTEVGEAWLTRQQLQERSGLDDAGIADLAEYGLLVPGPDGRYGPEALTIARISARLTRYGLEGRHLRPYRGTADREVGLLAQLVLPLSKQGGRAQALETVHELAALCAQLHGALVRQGLRAVLGP